MGAEVELNTARANRRVAINAASCVVGGGVQASAEFVSRVLADPQTHLWQIVVSRPVSQALQSLGAERSNRLHVIHPAPSHSRSSRIALLELLRRERFDLLFTTFGPSYIKPPCIELCGVADGWVTHSSSLAFRALIASGEILTMPARIVYKSFWLRQADYWTVEAEVAQDGLVRRLRLPKDRISVIPNSCATPYYDATPQTRTGAPILRILCFSAFYAHKNLLLVPRVAQELRAMRPDLKFEFVFTLPSEESGWQQLSSHADHRGVSSYLTNVGPIDPGSGPDLYNGCDIVFLPSLLETFSANYPEAMAMQRPIVTSDLPFARSICREAAEYFPPTDPRAAARALLRVAEQSTTRRKLVELGTRRLREFPSPRAKYDMQKQLILQLAARSAG